MNKDRFKFTMLILLAALFITGCADVYNVDECTLALPYTFWGGLWHGFIAAISFAGSLFYDDIAVYAVNNTGGWYDFGFLWGAGIILGAGGRATKR